MSKRQGVKVRGTHTTLNDLGARVVDLVEKVSGVTGVAPGRLVSNAGITTKPRVRIADLDGCILLTVRQSRSLQEVRVYTQDVNSARLAISRALRNDDIAICFRH